MANQERDPRAYELMSVFIPDLTDEDSQAEIEKIEGLVTANGGTMTETLTASPWGRRRLAYTIRYNGVDYRDGIYTVFHFDAAPSFLAEIEREMKLDTNIMRYLLVHDDPKAGEKFPQEDEDAESEEASTAPAAGSDAGDATASAAAQVASTAETTAPASEATEPAEAESSEAAESETPGSEASEPAESEAPATESETPAAETSEPAESETTEPAAAAEAPVEEAPAADTTTDTAPPAANEAASDDDKE